MTGKFLKLFFVIALCMGSVIQTNANIIKAGDIRLDAGGVEWKYVGQFDLAAGPFWNDADDRCLDAGVTCAGLFADALNGVQAAERFFGPLSAGETFGTSTLITIVNRLAHYDVHYGAAGAFSDSLINVGGIDGLYNESGDRSVFVTDRSGSKITYVFKTTQVPVPVPPVFAIFFLVICGLGLQRIRS